MARYGRIAGLMRSAGLASEEAYRKEIVPYLVGVWLDDYLGRPGFGSPADVVETQDAGFSYLFDVEAERLIAAWGFSHGRHAGARDSARMAGHPSNAGPLYHRGHAIPHTLGGPTDINLVPQLGKINIGPFRPLEKRAVATPGAMYFTYWSYSGSTPTRDGRPGQTPTGVDQGLIIPGHDHPIIARHGN